MCCQEDKSKSRILIYFGNTAIPKCFNDWWDFADYLKQEELAGRTVIFVRWEYI